MHSPLLTVFVCSDVRLEWDGASRTHAVVTWGGASAAGARQLSIAAVQVRCSEQLWQRRPQFKTTSSPSLAQMEFLSTGKESNLQF